MRIDFWRPPTRRGATLRTLSLKFKMFREDRSVSADGIAEVKTFSMNHRMNVNCLPQQHAERLFWKLAQQTMIKISFNLWIKTESLRSIK